MALRKVFGIRPLLGNEYVNRNRLKWSAALQTKIQREWKNIYLFCKGEKTVSKLCDASSGSPPAMGANSRNLAHFLSSPAHIITELRKNLFAQLCEVCSCCSSTVMPRPAWVLLKYVSNILSQLCKWGCYVYEL